MQQEMKSANFLVGLSKKILPLLLILACVRLLFFVCNYQMFAEETAKNVLLSFLVGMRFDMSSLMIINAPIIVLWALTRTTGKSNFFDKFLNFLFFFINSLAVIVETVDAKFFSFTSRRMSADILNQKKLLEEDAFVYVRMLCDFWYVAVFGVCMIVALYFFSTKIRFNRTFANGANATFVRLRRLFLSIAIVVIGERGGIQPKPIAPVDANVFAPTANTAVLVNNSLFNIIKTWEVSKKLPEYRFFSDEECKNIYSPIHDKPSLLPISKNFINKNVFVIILESFSAENIGALDSEFKQPGTRSFTPFLDSIIARSFVTDGFANGLVSVDGLASILTSIPPLFGYSFVTSQFTGNIIDSLPAVLRRNGYDTVFFFGGERNSLHFDGMRSKSEIEKYFCQDDYRGDRENIKGWGVYDSEFFPLVAEKLGEMKQPFFGALFTLSSHHPFIYPEKFHKMFEGMGTKFQDTVAYTDFSLKEFFKTVEKTDWYKNTVFVLVADHTAQQIQPYYASSIGRFSIPIIFFDPNGNMPRNNGKLMQQIDIMPSVLDLLGIQDSYFSFGTSVFRDEKKHFTVQHKDGLYQLITDKFVLRFDGEKSVEFYTRDDFLLKNNILFSEKFKDDVVECEKLMKAFLQEYSSALRNNKMSMRTIESH